MFLNASRVYLSMLPQINTYSNIVLAPNAPSNLPIKTCHQYYLSRICTTLECFPFLSILCDGRKSPINAGHPCRGAHFYSTSTKVTSVRTPHLPLPRSRRTYPSSPHVLPHEFCRDNIKSAGILYITYRTVMPHSSGKQQEYPPESTIMNNYENLFYFIPVCEKKQTILVHRQRSSLHTLLRPRNQSLHKYGQLDH